MKIMNKLEAQFMILGIGTDILNINRIRSTVMNPKDPFVKRVFTLREQKEASYTYSKELYYASRFAGKEAVFKSLSLEELNFSEIEILSKESGQPYVTLYGETAEKAKLKGVRTILISLSYDTDYAIAFALAKG